MGPLEGRRRRFVLRRWAARTHALAWVDGLTAALLFGPLALVAWRARRGE